MGEPPSCAIVPRPDVHSVRECAERSCAIRARGIYPVPMENGESYWS